jgi:uncharacterized protein YdeI (BOF family)
MKKTIIVTLLAAITFAATAQTQTKSSNQKTGEQKSPNTTGTTGNNTPRNINNSDRKTNTNGSGHVPNKADGNIPKKK